MAKKSAVTKRKKSGNDSTVNRLVSQIERFLSEINGDTHFIEYFPATHLSPLQKRAVLRKLKPGFKQQVKYIANNERTQWFKANRLQFM